MNGNMALMRTDENVISIDTLNNMTLTYLFSQIPNIEAINIA